MLPKRSSYLKFYNGETKWMYFFIEDNDVLEKYNTICDKVIADIKKVITNLSTINTFENQNKSSWWWRYRFL